MAEPMTNSPARFPPEYDLGSALLPAMLGFTISAVSIFFSRWLSAPVVADCRRILAPVSETARTGDLLVASSTSPAAVFGEVAGRPILAWQRSPWSSELRRYRLASALAAWAMTGLLVAGWLAGIG